MCQKILSWLQRHVNLQYSRAHAWICVHSHSHVALQRDMELQRTSCPWGQASLCRSLFCKHGTQPPPLTHANMHYNWPIHAGKWLLNGLPISIQQQTISYKWFFSKTVQNHPPPVQTMSLARLFETVWLIIVLLKLLDTVLQDSVCQMSCNLFTLA